MSTYDEPTEGRERKTSFRSADGLWLRGTFVDAVNQASSVTVLVHGGGVTRDEGGFFTRLALGLSDAGIASLRLDLRGHGESEGRQEDLTLSGVLNDIQAGVTHARQLAGTASANVLGASFSGGICGYYAAHRPEQVRRLVLINPLINYKKRFIDDKPYWANDQIDEAVGKELLQTGFLPHSPTFKLGRPLLNEIFYLRPDEAIGSIVTPTLIVHGTEDTFIPVASSRHYIARIQAEKRLLEVEGAQHGIAVHDDPLYRDSQTVQWQASVIESIAEWLS